MRKLKGLDLLQGMDWLSSYGVTIGCAAKTIRIATKDVTFGRAMTVSSGDLMRMCKTVRFQPRGYQRVLCQIRDLSRVGQEVLVEGTAQLGGELHVVPLLEVIREDGSLALTLEHQAPYVGKLRRSNCGQDHRVTSPRAKRSRGRSQPVFGRG